MLEKAMTFLADGKGLWEAKLTAGDLAALAPLTLLTTKPVLYAANVTDSIKAGIERARAAIESGAAKAKLEQLRAVANRA